VAHDSLSLPAVLCCAVLQVGLNNYSAAYATGLLLARRVLTKFGLADTYKVRRAVKGVEGFCVCVGGCSRGCFAACKRFALQVFAACRGH
jgi:ribosomal protein L18